MTAEPLRTLIVDDEPIAREILRDELEGLPGVQIVGEADDGHAALDKIRTLTPDLVLLDIQMPSMDGFDVVRKLDGPLPSVIFVTAYSEHAIRAFEVGAADYLLKPVAAERLKTALERVREARRSPVEAAENLARTLDAAEDVRSGRPRRIVARRGRDYYLLDLEELFAFQADGEIVWAVASDRRYMAVETLQSLAKRLEGTQFLRVHRGALVNLDKVRKMTSLSSQRWMLTLSNGLQVTVSKRQAHSVRDLLR